MRRRFGRGRKRGSADDNAGAPLDAALWLQRISETGLAGDSALTPLTLPGVAPESAVLGEAAGGELLVGYSPQGGGVAMFAVLALAAAWRCSRCWLWRLRGPTSRAARSRSHPSGRSPRAAGCRCSGPSVSRCERSPRRGCWRILGWSSRPRRPSPRRSPPSALGARCRALRIERSSIARWRAYMAWRRNTEGPSGVSGIASSCCWWRVPSRACACHDRGCGWS